MCDDFKFLLGNAPCNAPFVEPHVQAVRKGLEIPQNSIAANDRSNGVGRNIQPSRNGRAGSETNFLLFTHAK